MEKIISKIKQKITNTDNAHEASAWSEALRNIYTAIGIEQNIKLNDIRLHQEQKCQD